MHSFVLAKTPHTVPTVNHSGEGVIILACLAATWQFAVIKSPSISSLYQNILESHLSECFGLAKIVSRYSTATWLSQSQQKLYKSGKVERIKVLQSSPGVSDPGPRSLPKKTKKNIKTYNI